MLERNSGSESGILLAYKRTYSPSLLSLLVYWIHPQTCFRWRCYEQTIFLSTKNCYHFLDGFSLAKLLPSEMFLCFWGVVRTIGKNIKSVLHIVQGHWYRWPHRHVLCHAMWLEENNGHWQFDLEVLHGRQIIWPSCVTLSITLISKVSSVMRLGASNRWGSYDCAHMPVIKSVHPPLCGSVAVGHTKCICIPLLHCSWMVTDLVWCDLTHPKDVFHDV